MIMHKQGGTMDSRKIVYRETAIVAIGELALSAVMVGIFAAVGCFAWNVFWGALIGCSIMIFNHFFLAVTVSLAADRAEKGDAKRAQNMIQLSGTVRLVLMGAAAVLAIKLGCNPIAVLLPLLFVRPILMLAEFFGKKGD